MAFRTKTFSNRWGIPGLQPNTGTGALVYKIVLDDGTVAIANTNAGITVSPDDPGLYQVILANLDTTWGGEIRWTDGTVGREARESFEPRAGAGGGGSIQVGQSVLEGE